MSRADDPDPCSPRIATSLFEGCWWQSRQRATMRTDISRCGINRTLETDDTNLSAILSLAPLVSGAGFLVPWLFRRTNFKGIFPPQWAWLSMFGHLPSSEPYTKTEHGTVQMFSRWLWVIARKRSKDLCLEGVCQLKAAKVCWRTRHSHCCCTLLKCKRWGPNLFPVGFPSKLAGTNASLQGSDLRGRGASHGKRLI